MKSTFLAYCILYISHISTQNTYLTLLKSTFVRQTPDDNTIPDIYIHLQIPFKPTNHHAYSYFTYLKPTHHDSTYDNTYDNTFTPHILLVKILYTHIAIIHKTKKSATQYDRLSIFLYSFVYYTFLFYHPKKTKINSIAHIHL